jgi:hypothetical protein
VAKNSKPKATKPKTDKQKIDGLNASFEDVMKFLAKPGNIDKNKKDS